MPVSCCVKLGKIRVLPWFYGTLLLPEKLNLWGALNSAVVIGEVGLEAAAAVPESSLQNGLPSVRRLELELGTESHHGYVAPAVHEQYCGPVWTNALRAVFSTLKVPLKVLLDSGGEPRNDEERIRLMKGLLKMER